MEGLQKENQRLREKLERLRHCPTIEEKVVKQEQSPFIIGADMNIAEAKNKVKDGQVIVWSYNSNMFLGYRHSNKFTYSQLLTRTENY